MKIDQILVQHLYKTKQLTLQGIGTFTLNPSVAIPAENEKDFAMPQNAIEFEYNLKATEDNSLIEFIGKQTGKIKPLATADLDSYVILSKQFLNIGKPLTIEGIGTIQKSQQGDYEFIPGIFVTPKIDDIPRQVKEKRDESVSFESESRTPKRNKSLLFAAILLAIIIGGLGIYYFLFYEKDAVPQSAIAVQDSIVTDTPKAITPDTTLIPQQVPVVDNNSFKVVIREYKSKDAAEKAYTKFTSYGHNLSLYTADSLTYKIAMTFKRSLSDTLMVRDSLREFFLGNPYIELK
ncbi:MAG: hypothetical protein V4556_08085 [Bacteroidota bacterium]